jgi:hypothetical protein
MKKCYNTTKQDYFTRRKFTMYGLAKLANEMGSYRPEEYDDSNFERLSDSPFRKFKKNVIHEKGYKDADLAQILYNIRNAPGYQQAGAGAVLGAVPGAATGYLVSDQDHTQQGVGLGALIGGSLGAGAGYGLGRLAKR